MHVSKQVKIARNMKYPVKNKRQKLISEKNLILKSKFQSYTAAIEV